MARVQVEGYVNFAPEMKYLQSGDAVTEFQISESYTPRGGGDKVYTNYQVSVFGEDEGQALMSHVIEKQVYKVTGFLSLRSYVSDKTQLPVAVGNIRPDSIVSVNRGGGAKGVNYGTDSARNGRHSDEDPIPVMSDVDDLPF